MSKRPGRRLEWEQGQTAVSGRCRDNGNMDTGDGNGNGGPSSGRSACWWRGCRSGANDGLMESDWSNWSTEMWATHRPGYPLSSSVLSRDGAPRRDPCVARRWRALLLLWLLLTPRPTLAAAVAEGTAFDSGGNEGSGFAVMLDIALSVLEPVMELRRALSSGRGIMDRHQCQTL